MGRKRVSWWLLPASGRSNDDGVDFDLDQPARIDEPANFDERAGRPHMLEEFAMRAGRFAPMRNVDQHHARACDVIERRASLRESFGHDFEATPGLTVNVAGRGDAAALRDGRRPCDKDVGTHTYGARETDLEFERRT